MKSLQQRIEKLRNELKNSLKKESTLQFGKSTAAILDIPPEEVDNEFLIWMNLNESYWELYFINPCTRNRWIFYSIRARAGAAAYHHLHGKKHLFNLWLAVPSLRAHLCSHHLRPAAHKQRHPSPSRRLTTLPRAVHSGGAALGGAHLPGSLAGIGAEAEAAALLRCLRSSGLRAPPLRRPLLVRSTAVRARSSSATFLPTRGMQFSIPFSYALNILTRTSS